MVRSLYYYSLAVIVALATFSGIFQLSPYYYYGSVVVFLVLAFARNFQKIRLTSLTTLLFLAICALSIVINDPPSLFRSWERLVLFILIIVAFSNLLDNDVISIARMSFLDSLLKVCVLFSIGSFFAYFLGINYFVRNDELLAYNEAGHFSGFTSHSMLLGPIASCSSIYCASVLSSRKIQSKKFLFLFWCFLLLTSIGSLLLSASRGALLSTVVAFIVFFMRMSKGRATKFVSYILLVIAILLITLPMWENLGQYVLQKNNTNLENGGLFYSRDSKINARFEEIHDHFFTGVGFAAVDDTLDSVNRVTGTVEPGSSWLGVFSMTGIFGFVLFCLIILNSFRNAYRIIDIGKSLLISGLIAFFIVHMIIEGYILAGGHILCALCWLTVGVANSMGNKRER